MRMHKPALLGIFLLSTAAAAQEPPVPPPPPPPPPAAPAPTPAAPSVQPNPAPSPAATTKLDENDKKDGKELSDNVVIGESGVSSKRQWDLLGSTAVSTLDPSKPQVALGIQYVSPWTLFRVFLRKDVSSNEVSGAPGDRTFGEATLNPALANIGGTVRVEGGVNPWVLCNGGECQKDARGNYTGVVARTGFRGYGELSVSRAAFVLKGAGPNGTDRSISGVPLAASAGVMFRLEGVMPGTAKFGNNILLAAPYLGLGLRALGGDFGDNERIAVLGTNASIFAGPELGVLGQFGYLLFDLRTSILGPTNDIHQRVNGLTGVQLQLTSTFILPWNVLGGEQQKKDGGG